MARKCFCALVMTGHISPGSRRDFDGTGKRRVLFLIFELAYDTAGTDLLQFHTVFVATTFVLSAE